MTTENKSQNKGGRLTLKEQADLNHTKNEVRVDLAMAKMTDKVLKHLAKMVNGIEKLKENTQLSVIDRVLKANKDYIKIKRELEIASNPNKDNYEEEDEEIMVDLTSSETESQKKTLN